MKSGIFNLMLHSHLPYVLNHGKAPFGEEWLFEAVAESYVPLLNTLNELINQGISPKITISFSPILCEQLEDSTFTMKFKNYCYDKIQFAHNDKLNFIKSKESKEKIKLAEYWQRFYYCRFDEYYNTYNASIIQSFKKLQDNNHIEIITTAATHSYLPLFSTDESIEQQIELSQQSYQYYFGKKSNGIWLPECGYKPSLKNGYFDYRLGIDQIIKKYDFHYFFTDQQSVINSLNIQGIEDVTDCSLKLYQLESGIKVFVRNNDIAMQVWSNEIGYPGDSSYLEFHKKENTSNLRYWKITDKNIDIEFKELYDDDWQKKIDRHAYHFKHHLENIVNNYIENSNTKNNDSDNPVISLPFDTELFGHWWFEGIDFLKKFFIELERSEIIDTYTCSELLSKFDLKNKIINQYDTLQLVESSWGEGNDHRVWDNETTEWMWDIIHSAETRLLNLKKIIKSQAEYFINDSGYESLKNLLELANKEFMLLSSSDWEFMVTNQVAKEYAKNRFLTHKNNFNSICNDIDKKSFDKTISIKSENEYQYLNKLFQYGSKMD